MMMRYLIFAGVGLIAAGALLLAVTLLYRRASGPRSITIVSKGSCVFTLPLASANRLFKLKNPSANAIAVRGYGDEKIDGAESRSLRPGEALQFCAARTGEASHEWVTLPDRPAAR